MYEAVHTNIVTQKNPHHLNKIVPLPSVFEARRPQYNSSFQPSDTKTTQSPLQTRNPIHQRSLPYRLPSHPVALTRLPNPPPSALKSLMRASSSALCATLAPLKSLKLLPMLGVPSLVGAAGGAEGGGVDVAALFGGVGSWGGCDACCGLGWVVGCFVMDDCGCGGGVPFEVEVGGVGLRVWWSGCWVCCCRVCEGGWGMLSKALLGGRGKGRRMMRV